MKATLAHTSHAIHGLPVNSWANRKMLVATSAPTNPMKTIQAGHHNWNIPPITQAGIIQTASPGKWYEYISSGGRADAFAFIGGNGSGAGIPTKPSGWGASL